jgi:hypothetical protein
VCSVAAAGYSLLSSSQEEVSDCSFATEMFDADGFIVAAVYSVRETPSLRTNNTNPPLRSTPRPSPSTPLMSPFIQIEALVTLH